ncbi:hypothetical protein [Kitasatospora sp. NPDC094015]|uniref:hypothetical protein n=1 Tax=Kitasatospora sp. NPDC094015 TaxID=3155205 RepID=UPI00332FDE4C
MSDLPHADYLAAVHEALTAEGLLVRDGWTQGLVHRPSDLEATVPADFDGGFRFGPGQFHGHRWSEPETVWLGWEHHRGWSLMDEDSGLMPIHYFERPLPLSEAFADPTAVAGAVRRWLPAWDWPTPAYPDRWARADEGEAAVAAWHERNGRCLTRNDRHLVRVDGDEPADCPCPHLPCGSVTEREIREECAWHSGRIRPELLRMHGHAPEKCPGAASGT